MDLEQSLLALLRCPLCSEYCRPPLKGCLKGHLVCNNCISKSKLCSKCGMKMSHETNCAMNQVAGLMKFPCVNRTEGCTFQSRWKDMPCHETICPYLVVSCPAANILGNTHFEAANKLSSDTTNSRSEDTEEPCLFSGTLNCVKSHLLTIHHFKVLMFPYMDHYFPIVCDYLPWIQFFQCQGTIFRMVMRLFTSREKFGSEEISTNKCVFMQVDVIGLDREDTGYKYSYYLSNGDNKTPPIECKIGCAMGPVKQAAKTELLPGVIFSYATLNEYMDSSKCLKVLLSVKHSCIEPVPL